MKTNFLVSSLCLGAALALTTGFASTDRKKDPFHWVNSELSAWKQDTRGFMNRIPSKESSISEGRRHLPSEKQQIRSRVMGHKIKILSDIQANERPEDLIESMTDSSGNLYPILNTLEEMDSRKLLSVTLSNRPWSGYYWPTYQGGIANRYAAPGNPESSMNWLDYFNFSTQTVDTDVLSPVEKYELLVGEGQRSLTQYSWELGKAIYDSSLIRDIVA